MEMKPWEYLSNAHFSRSYQPGGSSGYKPDSGKDPLSNADDCLRDAVLLQRLGVRSMLYLIMVSMELTMLIATNRLIPSASTTLTLP